MNIMVIETATETVGVALRTEDGVLAEVSLTGRRRHVESLAPAMDHLLTQVGLAPGQLDVVAVDVGPGLFTGLRVGVAAAKGLAQALDIGVVAFTSLDILMRGAADAGHRGHVLAAVDARRGEVFAVLRHLEPDGGAVDVVAPRLFGPDDLVIALHELGGAGVTAVGDGAQRYAEVLAAVPHVKPVLGALSWPPPRSLMAMTLEFLAQGNTPVAARDIVPLYMREADARSNFAQVRRG
jgi:tRNA threonylcarbamoyladenosine biosynthesis protein TsaB